MTLVSPDQSNPNDEITADAINGPVNQIAAVINGNIDSTNISSVSGAKIQAGTVAAAAMDTNSNPETRMSESLGNFVASGCVWSVVSGLNASMSAGVVYINGKRIVVSLIASQTFVASKDTYVSVDNTGTVSIASAVANGAAAPSLPANSIWLAVVVTSGAAVTNIYDARTIRITGAWQSWTPSFTNLTLGNGTATAKYSRIGKLVQFRVTVVFGSTSAVAGAVSVNIPFFAASYAGTSVSIGQTTILDTGTALYLGPVFLSSTTAVNARVFNAAGTYASATQLTSAIPMTWTTGDELVIVGEYEGL